MNLRQQLQLKRALRNLRTWAPPISIGVIVGAGAFMFADRLGSASGMETTEPAAAATYQRPDRAQATALPRQTTLQMSSTGGHAPASTYYRNCDAARADGASSIRAGEPGYAAHLDRDDDGVACEPYPR